eukprot:6368682-Amphidinium_carterae.1
MVTHEVNQSFQNWYLLLAIIGKTTNSSCDTMSSVFSRRYLARGHHKVPEVPPAIVPSQHL